MNDPLFSVAGSRVLITGAGGSICSLVAQAFLERGATVVLHDFSQEKIDSAGKEMGNLEGKVFSLVGDLSDRKYCAEMVNEAANLMGGLDVVVNGAGMNRRKPIANVTAEDFDAIMSINFNAIYFVSQAAHMIMKRSGTGNIVNISSINARFSYATNSVYAASKAAVTSLTRTCALEWAGDGIRVNCLEPGIVKTIFTKPLWGDPERSKWLDDSTPMGRLANPEEIVGAIIFLASPASSYITGQAVVIDGGLLAGGDWDSYKNSHNS
jgi:NAD(P)-dependent dehydrogenase (short-subunit alcohol dehydrogenase family)